MLIRILWPIFQKNDFLRFVFNICCDLPRNVKVISFSTRNSQTPFSEKGLKMSTGRPPTKIFGESEFFIESLSKTNFEVGGPKNRRFWAYFQKWMSEISTSSEKTCFLCCRFFRKIEKMERYFWGCAPKFFLQKLMNVAHFVCEN